VIEVQSKLPVEALRERGHRAEVNALIDEGVAELAPKTGTRAACAAADAAQAGWYRRHRVSPAHSRQAPVPHRERVDVTRHHNQGVPQSLLRWSWWVLQAEYGDEQGCVVFYLADGGRDFGVAGLADESDGEVTEGGHDAGPGGGPHPRIILTECDIADVLQGRSPAS
jgi:hypothetical protein